MFVRSLWRHSLSHFSCAYSPFPVFAIHHLTEATDQTTDYVVASSRVSAFWGMLWTLLWCFRLSCLPFHLQWISNKRTVSYCIRAVLPSGEWHCAKVLAEIGGNQRAQVTARRWTCNIPPQLMTTSCVGSPRPAVCWMYWGSSGMKMWERTYRCACLKIKPRGKKLKCHLPSSLHHVILL